MKSIFVESGFYFTDRYGLKEYDSLVSRFVIRDNSFIPSPYIVELWDDRNLLVSGRYISDLKETNGEKVTLLDKDINKYRPELLKDDTTVMINGEEYTIIGTYMSFEFVVPFLSMPENRKLFNNLSILGNLKKSPTMNIIGFIQLIAVF